MIDFYGDFESLFSFDIEVLRKKFGQIFAVIFIVFVNIIQKENKPLPEVDIACLAASKNAAIIYSLLGSCRLANLNPNVWLSDVLNRLPDQSIQRLSELLPMNLKPVENK